MATVLSFVRPARDGWSNEDRAQFVRIQRILLEAGLSVEIEEGVTDEGDPWCVLCSGMTGEVVVHIACLDGTYLLDSPALSHSIRERSLDDCARRFAGDAMLLVPRTRHDPTIAMHPSAMLAALILTIFLYVEALEGRAGFGEPVPEAGPADPGESDAEEAPVQAEAVPEGADPEGDGSGETGKALDDLRQGMHEAADLFHKSGTERLCWNIPGLNQSWAMALPAGAFATAMAHIWTVLDTLPPTEPETTVAGTGEDARETGEPRRIPPVETAGTQAQDPSGTGDVPGSEDTALIAEPEAADALVDSFILVDSVSPAMPSVPQNPAPVTGTVPQDSFLFAGTAAAEALATAGEDRVTETGAPARETTAPAPLSKVTQLMEFFPDDTAGFWSDFVITGDFMEPDVSPGSRIPAEDGPDAAQGRASAPAASSPAGAAVSAAAPAAAPAKAIWPQETPREAPLQRDPADLVTAFVTLTGRVFYELEDGNLLLQDADIIGIEEDPGVETRVLELPDSEIVFVGFADDLDTIFA